jgi:hypothetical protein
MCVLKKRWLKSCGWNGPCHWERYSRLYLKEDEENIGDKKGTPSVLNYKPF